MNPVREPKIGLNCRFRSGDELLSRFQACSAEATHSGENVPGRERGVRLQVRRVLGMQGSLHFDLRLSEKGPDASGCLSGKVLFRRKIQGKARLIIGPCNICANPLRLFPTFIALPGVLLCSFAPVFGQRIIFITAFPVSLSLSHALVSPFKLFQAPFISFFLIPSRDNG